MNPDGTALQRALALTRPGQWPILTAQFFVGVLLVAPGAQGGGCWLNTGSLLILGCAWLAWVVFLNGGTLAFNSAYDRDTGPVAYLPDPPSPPRHLALASTIWMAAGALLGWFVVGAAFGAVIAVCVVLSILYSHGAVRWKSVPGMDLVINMLGYGVGTTLAGVLAGRAAYLVGPDQLAKIGSEPLAAFSACGVDRIIAPVIPAGDGLTNALVEALGAGGIGWIVLGFGLLFGSLYPLTQLYQVEEDRERGDRTLSTALGTQGALKLALVLGAAATGAFVLGLLARTTGLWIVLPAAALAVWLGHLVIWLLSEVTYTPSDHERGMYRALNLWAAVDLTLLLAWIF